MTNDRFKFRVWDAENHKYRYDCEMSANHDVYAWEHMTDRCIPEQCTGLRDRNGKLIYEGDVLRYSVPGFPPQIVAWHQKTCRWVLRVKADVDMLEATSFCDDFTTDYQHWYTIVGNIHEVKE